MIDPIGIEAHAFDLSPCLPIILGTDSIIQDEFCLALRSVDLDREQVPTSNAMHVSVQLLSDDERTVLDTIEVPADGAGWPTVGVIVYKDQYFIGPEMSPHAAMPWYVHVPGFVVLPRE